MMSEKDIIADILQQELDEIRSIKGTALAKIAANELEILVERFRRGELTLEQLQEPWMKIINDFTMMAKQAINGMMDDINKGWRSRA